VSGPGEVGGVGSAGERDDEGGKFREIGEELRFLFRGGGRERFVETNLDYGAHVGSIAQEMLRNLSGLRRSGLGARDSELG